MIKSIKINELSLFDLIEHKTTVADIVKERQSVERVIGGGKEYVADTKLYYVQLHQIIKAIDNKYDEEYNVATIGYEFIENILDRERDKSIIDDDGKIFIEKFKTGIDAFDDHLTDGGFAYGSVVAISGETNSGKSDVVYMMIRSAIQNGLKVHLHSYELGYLSLFRNFDFSQKNKLNSDFTKNENKNLFSIDMLAKEMSDLKRMILLRKDDGCRIFVLDSLTKITVNNILVLDKSVIDVSEMLRELAHAYGILIILIGQKDKNSKINNSFEMYGSVMQEHIFDYMFFIGYENSGNKVTSEREIVMIKNRDDDTKGAIITEYDPDTKIMKYLKDSNSLGAEDEKAENWGKKIRGE